jgi:hypothetical protein
MAGDWLKMRVCLHTHPKVVRISSALNADKLKTVGALHAVWCLFDAHSTDGRLDGYTPEILDAHIGWTGFSAQMIAVGWLEIAGAGLVTPSFDKHNGQSAKRRAQEADRKREDRAIRSSSASNADKLRTREEKNKDISPIPPTGGKKPPRKRETHSLQVYLDECKAAEVSPIAADDPVVAYAEDAKIPNEFLDLQWREFKARYRMPDAKQYKRWPVVFAKSVRGNWFKLWYFDNSGQCYLTTAGIQARNTHKGAA